MLKDLNVEYIILLLMELNDSYDTLCDQILLQDPLSLINKVFSLIVQAKNQRAPTVPNPIVNAFASTVESQPSSVASESNVAAMTVRSIGSSVLGFSRRPRLQCTYCGRLVYIESKCYKKTWVSTWY